MNPNDCMKLYRTILYFCLFVSSYLFLVSDFCFALEQNIFGLHLTQPSDLYSAAKVINTNGGDWGWVTIVLPTNQLNYSTWQDFFDNCRRLHLIPIIRLATHVDGENWKAPELSDIDSLVNFLNSLNWPTATQHIILFNEINHPGEWGGRVDVKNYVDTSLYTINKLKSLNPYFFILSSGLDLASPDKNGYLSASSVYQQIYAYHPEYFEKIDGLASHSYPNHGFVGTPADTGQHSIRGYQWELNFLRRLGVKKELPVFITETGWPHREGISTRNGFYTTQTTSKFLIQALSIWQKDSRIHAVTPFIYNYSSQPFDHFSWLDPSEKLYPSYQKLVDLTKSKNTPLQTTNYQIIENRLPFILLTNTEYLGKITLKNTGQSIWGETNFCLQPNSSSNITVDQLCNPNIPTEPGKSVELSYKLTIHDNNPASKSYISWQGLPEQEITPLNGTGTIYSPKTTLIQKFIQYFQNWFI